MFNFNVSDLLKGFIVDGVYPAKLISIDPIANTDTVRFTFVLDGTGETKYIDRSNTLKKDPRFKGDGIHEVKSFVARLANATATTDSSKWNSITVDLEISQGFIRNVMRHQEQAAVGGVLY